MCFDVSMPIRLICSTDGLLCLRSATTSFLARLMPSGAVHTTVGGGMQDEPHLVGERAAAACAVGGELSLVQLDQVLGLTSGAVERFVDVLGRPRLDAGHDEADVEA